MSYQSDLPPAYNGIAETPDATILTRIKVIKSSSKGTLDFGKKLCVLIAGTLGCTIGLGLTLAIPVAMITVGAIYVNDCLLNPYIPIYLIVMGSSLAVYTLFSMVRRACSKGNAGDSEEQSTLGGRLIRVVDFLFTTFHFAWFTAGNYWIYHTWAAGGCFINGNGAVVCSEGNCNSTLLLFAFWLTTATYILIGLCCCTCFVGICICVKTAASK